MPSGCVKLILPSKSKAKPGGWIFFFCQVVEQMPAEQTHKKNKETKIKRICVKVTWAEALAVVVGAPLGWACPVSVVCGGDCVFSVPRHTESAHPLQDPPQESRPVNSEDRDMSQHVRVSPCPRGCLCLSALLGTK